MKTKSIAFRFFFTFCAAVGMFLTTAAQTTDTKMTAEERAQKLSDKMKTELSLTDEQYEKVKAVNLKYAKKNDEIRNGSGGKLSKYKSIKSSQSDKKKEMKAILTEEQYKKYEQMMEDAENEARERMKNRNG